MVTGVVSTHTQTMRPTRPPFSALKRFVTPFGQHRQL
jgi:hypothetical protein